MILFHTLCLLSIVIIPLAALYAAYKKDEK